ncbi:MAG: hypothetical protein ABEL04_00735 [Salinibacter sp.]|uniref:hypothetical protein n=1 Tax=Salinibacter sp. TaxID=2065818 RepID=UPI0035D47BD9
MGKYIVLATLAIALSTTILANQGLRTDLDTNQSQVTRQETVLARQIALSAFEMGLSNLKRDFTSWRVQRTEVAYEGGTFDLTASGPSSGPVSLTAVGHFGGVTYRITGKAEQKEVVSGLFNGITAGGSVDFNVSGPGCSGGPCVSGIDPAGGENRRGISLPHSGTQDQDEKDVCDEFGDKVEGKGDGCDVSSRSQALEEWIDNEMDNLKSEIESQASRGSDDVTVCESGDNSGNGNGNGNGNSGGPSSSCRLNGSSTGSGILYVKGDMVINGQAQWNGPVYVADGGSIRINGGGGTANINGGLLMEGNTELDMNGGNRVQYNSEKIEKYFNTVSSLSTTIVQVTNRSGGLVR